MEQNSTEQVDCNSIELDADKVNSCQILMDINDINIGTLKSALQALVPQENLSDYDIWLQDFKKLDQSHKLADDCMTVDGLVQVNVEILFIKKQITILDVIQPSEEMTRFTELQHIDQHINTNGVACIENAVNNSEGIHQFFPNNFFPFSNRSTRSSRKRRRIFRIKTAKRVWV